MSTRPCTDWSSDWSGRTRPSRPSWTRSVYLGGRADVRSMARRDSRRKRAWSNQEAGIRLTRGFRAPARPPADPGPADARFAGRCGGRGAGGLAAAGSAGLGCDRQPGRLVDHRGRSGLPRRAALPEQSARTHPSTSPSTIWCCSRTTPPGPRMTRCLPIRSDWRCWSCSMHCARTSGWPSSCTTCSQCPSTTSAGSSASRPTRQRCSPAGLVAKCGSHRAPGELRRERSVVDAFLAAARGGDFEDLLRLLDPDVILRVHTPEGRGRQARGDRGGHQSPAGRTYPDHHAPGTDQRRPGHRRVAAGRPAAGHDGVHCGGRSNCRDHLDQ